ncbi:4-hydroxy-tetrahydrodipicolinate reductase [Pseudidiomarina sp.]|uniref:4-hydroxy-tetrahydrodipicolinate reductase n=1 Tax=Pseudidiomarina sp. TaxID=2081707 RepID=UPI00299F1B82|nr:4-hydroxy-tetrahydrodipicolinate reductase [Pseudidiomarina sp.]MDX1705047.1 4-hydroxy-tetrahydrodipicolinate reductase [Pseudidiomarina sp.]
MIKIGVIGASGRMGQSLLMAAEAHAQMTPAAALVSADSVRLGQPTSGGLTFMHTDDLIAGQIDVLVDFSLPEALVTNLATAQRLQVPIVVCTTGLTSAQQELMEQAAAEIPVLYAANTSVGVTLLQQLVQLASFALPDADIEIIEAHHQHKRDAPSGTALVLGESAAAGRKQELANVTAGIRGDGQRRPGSIGFASIRAADIVGEHCVLMAQTGERLELSHKVSDRRVFATGALQAARWLSDQPAGRYRMADMLDLKQALKDIL